MQRIYEFLGNIRLLPWHIFCIQAKMPAAGKMTVYGTAQAKPLNDHTDAHINNSEEASQR